MKYFKRICIIIFFLFFAHTTYAATLDFSTAQNSYSMDQTISVRVTLSSPDQSANAASGVVNFSPDKLQVVSVSKSGSRLDFWVSEPTFSNSQGTVSFTGVILSKGFTGRGGQIVTINFKPKTVGTTALSISSPQILANDGNGTSILTGTGKLQLTITPAVQKPTPKPTPTPEPTPVPSATTTPVKVTVTQPKLITIQGRNYFELLYLVIYGIVTTYLLVFVFILLLIIILILLLLYIHMRRSVAELKEEIKKNSRSKDGSNNYKDIIKKNPDLMLPPADGKA